MTDFKPGEIVDIEIKGARVINSYTTGVVEVDGKETNTGTILVFRHPGEHGKADRSHTVNLAGEGVTVALAAPVEWPPQVGDLWRDHEGGLWFARGLGGSQVILACQIGAMDDCTPGQAHETYGPFTLVHREATS